MFEKYKNPDPRCRYPFTDSPLGYCWGWASYVDGKESFAGFKDMALCHDCEFFAPTCTESAAVQHPTVSESDERAGILKRMAGDETPAERTW